MQPPDIRSQGMHLLFFILICLSGLAHLSTALELSPWQMNSELYSSVDPVSQALELSLHSRLNSDNTSAIVVNDHPTEPDNKLTWELAIGKGGNLIKLQDSADPSQCGVEQSEFTEWKQLSENGWSKQYQGSPKGNTTEGEKAIQSWKDAASALKFSTDDKKNTHYILKQTENVTIAGKKYRQSGGLYNNIINTDGGIFALENTSPRTRGATQKPSLDGTPGNELVPLQSWADVSFIELVDACKGHGKCVKGLKLVVICHPENKVTNRIATQALGGPAQWTKWPGKNFSKKSQQFAALMATPSGRGVAWLLLTHREQLGFKYVESIDVWSEKSKDSGQTLYAFYLKDHADSKQTPARVIRDVGGSVLTGDIGTLSRDQLVRRDVRGNGSSIVYDENRAAHSFKELYQSDHDYNVNQAEAVGGYLTDLAQVSLNRSCVQQSKWKFSDLQSNGWTSFAGKTSNSRALDGLNQALSDAKLPKESDGPKRITWKHDTAKTIDGKAYPATHVAYDALYSKQAIVILDVSNPVESKSEEKDKDKMSPPLKTLSDILWLQWEDWCKSQKANVTALRYILMDGTANPSTKRAIADVLAGKKAGAFPGKVFGADSKEFATLLASPQGQGVAWLLSQHKAQLDTKTIKSCRIWDTQDRTSLLVELTDTTSLNKTKTQRSMVGESTGRALARRADDKIPWDVWVTKGKALLQMLQCGSGPSSKFESHDGLEEWGWERMEHEPVKELGKTLTETMDYLGVDSKNNKAWSIAERHTTLKVIDGKKYAPTQGSYQLTYNSEFISADNNWGPRSEGPNQTPKVDGVDFPFPLLEKLSDVSFLVFQKLMKETRQPMDRLKGFLRSGVVNPETLSITSQALRLKETEAHPKWPGRDFKAQSDGFAALLASPNGCGVAWFLGQHKAQLGHKTITSIRVWGEHDDVFLLFVFEDVSDSGDDESVETSTEETPPQEIASLEAPSSSKTVWETLQCKLFGLFCGPGAQNEQRSLDIAPRGDGDPLSLPVPQFPNRNKPKVKIDWNLWVDKGKSYLEMLRCGSIKDSKWKSYDDLAKNGWKVVQERNSVKIYDKGGMRKAMDFLKISSKPEDQWSVAQQHLVKKTVNGKTYFPTSALYDNKYNTELITADNNFGPRYKGPEQPDPPVTGDPNPFPELQQLSDVMYLEFARLMKQSKKPLNKLKGVLRAHVINAETRAIAAKAVGLSASKLHDKTLAWPGRDFSAGSDEFAALIASPNGRAVVWLLATHSDLGPKTISSVKVYDDEGLWILYVFKDREDDAKNISDDKSKPSGRRDLTVDAHEPLKNNITHGRRDSAISLASEHLPVDHAKALSIRALEQDTYDKIVEMGKILVSALLSPQDCMAQSEWTNEDALAKWGWYRMRKPSVGPVSFFPATIVVYEFVGASMEKEKNHRSYDSHADKKEIDGVTYFPSGAEFDVRYNPSMIIAEGIYGAEHMGKDQRPPVTGDPNPYPKLKSWSDVTFLEYQKFMHDTGESPDALKAVWHRAIINPTTRELAARFFNKDDWHDVPDWPGKDFTPGSEEFNALIGSDNGKGVVYLLLQHRKQLGNKAIIKARAWKDHTLHILYIFDDVCSEGESEGDTSEMSERSLVRRMDELDSQKVNDARSSGRFLVIAQDSSTEILESCLNIKQSIFVQTKQLRDSGWKLLSDRTTAFDEDSDAATFNSWLDMNLDLTANANHDVEYQHLEKTTGSDGTAYYATGAYYKDVFSEGGIVAKDNASPWKMGATRDPPVDGKARPFPPLKQWSDAVFLAYKDVCKGDPVKMKKLKACLRHNVINIAARQILHEYMGKHGELESGRPKPWPGTLYKLDDDDDGFNVALGVPNGKGVAYLLATHRESLGWKEIYQIRIFSVGWDSSYNILYYIRDHKEDAQRRHALSEVTIPRRLQSRALSDEDYEKARKKGSILLCQLYASASTVKGSPWTDPKSLEDYGWAESDTEYKWEYNAPDNDIGPALKDLGVSTDAFDNIKYGYWHTGESKHDGHTYPPTFGFYQNVFNVKSGVVIADSNFGPDYEKKFGTTAETVPLKQYSDVVFLAWQKQAGNNIKNLKYVFRHKIVNPATTALLTAVLEKRKEKLKTWPGTKISMIEKDAQAILGTSNGHGVAYLLAQHKEQLGVKVIDSVTIFESDHLMSLCFWIVDEDDDGASLQPSTDPAIKVRALYEISSQPEPQLGLDPLPQNAYSTWTGVLARRLGNITEACWTAFRVA